MGDNKWKLNTEISYDTFSFSFYRGHYRIFHAQPTPPNQTIVVGFSIQRIFGE